MTVLPPQIAAALVEAHQAELMQYAERRRALPQRRSATWSFLRSHLLHPRSRRHVPASVSALHTEMGRETNPGTNPAAAA